MWKSLFHVCLFVNDIKKSVDYYEKIGLEVLFDMGNGDGGEPWNYYVRIAKGQYLELQPVNSPNPHPHPSQVRYHDDQTIWHFSLETDNIAQTVTHLLKNGIRVWKGPDKNSPPVCSVEDVVHGADGCLIVWIMDPDGNPIEIMEQTEQSLQRLHEHD